MGRKIKIKITLTHILLLAAILCSFFVAFSAIVGAADYSYSATKGKNRMEGSFGETTGAVSVHPLTGATAATAI